MAEPFNEYVLKIASRCNLRCTYCYEYSLGDESWRRNARRMSESTALTVAARIREHSIAHNVQSVCVSFHGGEPLFAGPEHIDRLASILRDAAQGAFELTLTMQTNAMLIDKSICEVLSRHCISVSVSIDGGRVANDRHRIFTSGRSSYQATVDGIRLLQQLIPGQPSGLLAVIDVKNDPLEVFDDLASLGIGYIDFLLPHHHWDRLPDRVRGLDHEYGEWYWKIFDAWTKGRHSHIEIRFFDNIVKQFLSAPSNFEVMNLAPVRLVTVNTDGDIESVDTLKSTSPGIQQTGLNIRQHSFDEALKVRLIASRQSKMNQLAPKCRACTYVKECAGGYFPHRYSEANQFENPSVYCSDLYWLLDRIAERLHQTTAKHNTVVQQQTTAAQIAS